MYAPAPSGEWPNTSGHEYHCSGRKIHIRETERKFITKFTYMKEGNLSTAILSSSRVTNIFQRTFFTFFNNEKNYILYMKQEKKLSAAILSPSKIKYYLNIFLFLFLITMKIIKLLTRKAKCIIVNKELKCDSHLRTVLSIVGLFRRPATLFFVEPKFIWADAKSQV